MNFPFGAAAGTTSARGTGQRCSMQHVIVIDHPVVQTKLTELRDFSADHRKFRTLLDEIAALMVYEVTRDWPTTPKPVQTPLERTTGRVLARQVTLVPILRAGLGMADGVLKLLPDARLKIYPDSAHGFLFQHHDRFAADVHAFLEEAD